MEGDSIVDMPLDEVLDTHIQSGASITCLSKEFDMSKDGKGAKITDVESEDVFGLSPWTDEHIRSGQQSKYQFNRMILRTNKNDSSSS